MRPRLIKRWGVQKHDRKVITQMSEQQTNTYPTKIAKLAGRDEFLDFTDGINFWRKDNELNAGRIVMRYTSYGAKPKYSCTHYLGVSEALTICDDILGFRFRKNMNTSERGHKGEFAPIFEHMRGGDGKGYGHPEWPLCSSTLKITVDTSSATDKDGNLKYPNDKMVFVEITQCPGVRTDKGIVSPERGSNKVTVRFSALLSDIRPKLAMLKAFIEAKLATSTMMEDIHKEDFDRRLNNSKTYASGQRETSAPETTGSYEDEAPPIDMDGA